MLSEGQKRERNTAKLRKWRGRNAKRYKSYQKQYYEDHKGEARVYLGQYRLRAQIKRTEEKLVRLRDKLAKSVV